MMSYYFAGVEGEGQERQETITRPMKEGNAKLSQVSSHFTQLKRAQKKRTMPTIFWERQHRNGYKPKPWRSPVEEAHVALSFFITPNRQAGLCLEDMKDKTCELNQNVIRHTSACRPLIIPDSRFESSRCGALAGNLQVFFLHRLVFDV